ncbi:MAG: hypothetical protein R2874_08810 [Desulfobacterales bacterium]
MTRANIRIYGEKEIPRGSVLFAVNHFTRMETFFIPYYIHRLTGQTIWALAADELLPAALKIFWITWARFPRKIRTGTG